MQGQRAPYHLSATLENETGLKCCPFDQVNNNNNKNLYTLASSQAAQNRVWFQPVNTKSVCGSDWPAFNFLPLHLHIVCLSADRMKKGREIEGAGEKP